MHIENNFNQILVNRLLQRDVTALDYLYDHYSAALMGIIQRTLQNNQIAEEVLHDVFLKIWNQIEKFDPKKGTLFTWMYRIARNQALDARRSRDFKTSEKSNELDNYVNIFEASKGNEDFIGLSKVIKQLGDTCKKLIQLNFFMSYSHAEISKQEKMALGTVKTKLRGCLKNLKIQLKEFE